MKMRSSIICNSLIALALTTAITACNEKDDSEEYINAPTLAVTSFSLKYDYQNVGVDSVYFAIDLNRGVIYNPDSLAPGTPVNKLIPVIGYNSAAESVTLTMSGGDTRTGTVDYKTNPTDSIDFTGKVVLTIANGAHQRSYNVKVNVHKEYADSLRWDETAVATLPSRLSNPSAQKTVALDNGTSVALIREADNSYTFASTTDLYAGEWTRKEVSFNFSPRLESLAASDNNLYILDDHGNLMTCEFPGDWTDTGRDWNCIIGGYVGSAVGLETSGGTLKFAQYPEKNLNAAAVPDDFPRSGFSNFVTLQNKWTLSPVAFFTGGRKADNTLSTATWAFDGTEWIRLNDSDLPAMEQSVLIPYYYYRATATGSAKLKYSVWLLIGGRMADDTASRTVYISYDNGVNWRKGASLLQLPEAIPGMWGCDNVVAYSDRSASIADYWETKSRSSRPERIDYDVNGNTISWKCPYIYLIGGYGPGGTFHNSIWRGVLSRLTFVPII